MQTWHVLKYVSTPLHVLFIEILGFRWQSVFWPNCFIHWDMGCPMAVSILACVFYSLRYEVSHGSLYSGLYVLFIEILGFPWQSVFWPICFIHWDMRCLMTSLYSGLRVLFIEIWGVPWQSVFWPAYFIHWDMVSHGSLYSGLRVLFIEIWGVSWRSVFWPACFIHWDVRCPMAVCILACVFFFHWDMGCPMAVCILACMFYSLRCEVSQGSLHSGLFFFFFHWDMGCPKAVCILACIFYSLRYWVSHGCLYSGLYVVFVDILGVPWQSVFWPLCCIRWYIGCPMAVCIQHI